MRLDRKKVALRLQIGDQRLAAGVAIHALILAGIAVHGRIVVHDLDLFQSVPLADKEVVGVVRGRDLDAPRSEPDFHIVIARRSRAARCIRLLHPTVPWRSADTS